MKTYEEALRIAVPVGIEAAIDNACRYKEIISEIEHNQKTIDMLNSLFTYTDTAIANSHPEDCEHCIWMRTLRSAFALGIICGIEMEKAE